MRNLLPRILMICLIWGGFSQQLAYAQSKTDQFLVLEIQLEETHFLPTDTLQYDHLLFLSLKAKKVVSISPLGWQEFPFSTTWVAGSPILHFTKPLPSPLPETHIYRFQGDNKLQSSKMKWVLRPNTWNVDSIRQDRCPEIKPFLQPKLGKCGRLLDSLKIAGVPENIRLDSCLHCIHRERLFGNDVFEAAARPTLQPFDSLAFRNDSLGQTGLCGGASTVTQQLIGEKLDGYCYYSLSLGIIDPLQDRGSHVVGLLISPQGKWIFIDPLLGYTLVWKERGTPIDYRRYLGLIHHTHPDSLALIEQIGMKNYPVRGKYRQLTPCKSGQYVTSNAEIHTYLPFKGTPTYLANAYMQPGQYFLQFAEEYQQISKNHATYWGRSDSFVLPRDTLKIPSYFRKVLIGPGSQKQCLSLSEVEKTILTRLKATRSPLLKQDR